MRRHQNTDTPRPPEVPAGQNPPDGAMIDYYLAADARGPVTLEITSASRNVVRRFSSADAPEPYDEKSFNVPMYWARPPRTLPATKGMHRFVWDLRYPRPGAVQRDFPISAIVHDTPLEPLGVLAVPGVYTVTLTVDGKTFTQPITLKMDPRATIAPLGLRQQFTLATRIVDLMNKTYAAAVSLEPQCVDDVHAFPGHIACDAASRAELVVPIVVDGRLAGVLDLDSPVPGRFDHEDTEGCVKLIQRLETALAGMAEEGTKG
jgi:hypothetical protein